MRKKEEDFVEKRGNPEAGERKYNEPRLECVARSLPMSASRSTMGNGGGFEAEEREEEVGGSWTSPAAEEEERSERARPRS